MIIPTCVSISHHINRYRASQISVQSIRPPQNQSPALFTLPWTNNDGSKAFCFVHGPYSMMGKVLKKVAYEKVDCILIAPAWPQYWVAMLQSLPIVATAEIAGDAVPGKRGARENIYVRGSRASEETIASSVYWKTSAYLVRYSVRVTKPIAVKEGTERMDVWPSFEGPL